MKPIKLIHNVLIMAMLTLLVGSNQVLAQYSGDKYVTTKSKKTANFTYAYVNTPGFIEKDASGKMKGLLVDVMNEFEAYVKKEMGITVTAKFVHIKDDDFKKMMDNVKASSGGVFGLSNVTITSSRKKVYSFSPPYISNISVLVSHKNVPTLNSLSGMDKAFSGKTAYTIKGGTYHERINGMKLKYYSGLKIDFRPSEIGIIDIISKDQQAISIVDFVYYLAALQDKKPIKRHAIGDSDSEEFGIVMPRSNDWAPILNKFFKGGFINGSNYRKIIANNLGSHALQLLDGIAKK